jgi:hypothetical protein
MRPEDYRALVNAVRSQQDSGARFTDDITTSTRLSVAIARLSYPDPNIPHNTRKAAVLNELNKAMGYDDITGQTVGAPQLTRSTFFALMGEVTNSDNRIINDPRLNLQIEKTYRILTGAGRDSIAMITGDRKDLVLAAEYEADITNAALEVGPSFDPVAWHNKHWPEYNLANIQAVKSDIRSQQLEAYVVFKNVTNNSGSTSKRIDYSATINAISELIKSNSVDDEFGAELINEAYRQQQAEGE